MFFFCVQSLYIRIFLFLWLEYVYTVLYVQGCTCMHVHQSHILVEGSVQRAVLYTVHCILDTSAFPIFCGQDYFGQNIVKIAHIYLVFTTFFYYWLLYFDQNNHDRKKIGIRKCLLYLQILRG